MRREAIFCVLMGSSLQVAAAADQYPITAPRGVKPSPTAASSYRAQSGTESNPFEQFQREQLAADPARHAATVGPTSPNEPQTPSPEDVIHAEYRHDPNAAESAIEQIRLERFGRTQAPSTYKRATPPLTTETFGPSATQPDGSLLSVPISTEPSSPGMSPANAQQNMALRAGESATPQPAAPSSVPQLKLEWLPVSNVNVGQESECVLLVKNPGKSVARGVQIATQLPQGVRIVRTNPPSNGTTAEGTWALGDLEPGAERRIQLTVVPSAAGDIAASAEVRFSGMASTRMVVTQPELMVEVSGPHQVRMGEQTTHIVTVSNPGSGAARHVRLEALVPEGLEHVRGKRLLLDMGPLNPRESRTVRLALTATAGGMHEIQFNAHCDSVPPKAMTSSIQVVAPKLAATIQGPGLRYRGRQGTYLLTVRNDGDAATDNVRVMHQIPEGFEYVRADRGAQFDAASSTLTWFVGRMEPGESAQIQVILNSDKIGDFEHRVLATSENGGSATTELVTRVEGTPSLSVNVTDSEDPVEIGTDTVYEIRVKNEGSAPAKNVGLICEMSGGMAVTNVESQTKAVQDRQFIRFEPTAELGPGETLEFRVHVSAARQGNLRFRAQLTSDSIGDPLTTEELTKFYGE